LNFDDNEKVTLLRAILAKEKIEIEDTAIRRLAHFAAMLHEWNSVHNLTGAKTLEAIYEHILDALYPLGFIDTPETLLDVGTGAGFPGLVLAIALPETQVTLCEPLKKRVAFLKYAAVSLELDNVTVAAVRVEKLRHKPFELITSRAVTDTALLLKLTEHLSDERTHYLFYKGSRVTDELDALQEKLRYDIIRKSQRNYLYIKARYDT
jgi:16S rRNA (guanine527-N7)-methyltransferase